MSLTKVSYSMIDGASVNVIDFGATGDGSTDDYPAIQNAINYLRDAINLSNTNHSNIYRQAAYRLYLPAGKYMLSKPLVFDFSVAIEGETPSGFGSTATVLQFTSLTAGLVFLWSDTGNYPIYDYTTNLVTSLSATPGTPGQILNGSPATGNASGSSVSNLVISGYGSGTSIFTFVGKGQVTGTSLNVTTTTSGALTVGSLIFTDNSKAGAKISAFGTGTGGNGTYTVNESGTNDGITSVFGVSGNSFNGIECHVVINLNNVNITNFHGHGIAVYGESNSTAIPSVYGGADAINFQTILSNTNDGHGLYICGTDSQIGCVITSQFNSNKGYGVYDGSALGNTYMGGQASYNTLGSWGSFFGTGKTIFINSYAEDGVKHIGRDAFSIGGISNGGFEGYIDTVVPSVIIGGSQTGLQSTPVLFRRLNETPETQLGTVYAKHEFLRGYDSTYLNSGASWSFKYSNTFPSGGFFGDVLVLAVQDETYSPYWISASTTTFTYGTSAAIPGQFTVPSLGLSQRRILNNSAIPSSGNYAVGDIIFNTSVVAGGSPGWVCTTAGVAGSTAVFKTMAVVAA